MNNWTEQEVIKKLNEGWCLSGDIAAQAPFGFINPSRQVLGILQRIPADMARRLSESGILTPEPAPGKKVMYRRASH